MLYGTKLLNLSTLEQNSVLNALMIPMHMYFYSENIQGVRKHSNQWAEREVTLPLGCPCY